MTPPDGRDDYDMIRTVNMLRLFPRALFVAVLLLSVSCKDTSPPGSPPPGSTGPESVTGTERIGWLQPIENAGDIGRLRYAVYVDGDRRLLEGETCRATTGRADCSAPLPALSAGLHTLQIAAFVTSGDEIVEGPRSAAVTVNVAALVAAAPPSESVVPALEDGPVAGSDGVTLHARVLARDLVEPVDLAVLTSGRVFVAQRNGTLRTIDPPADTPAHPQAENVLNLFPDALPQNAALLSIATPADQPRTRHLHLLYASHDRDQPVVRLGRVREAGGTFGEAAVLASFALSGSPLAATLRFGPDGRQYVGLGAVDAPEQAQNPSAAAGKILRLDAGGATPDDNPFPSPVLTLGHRDPRGFAWLEGFMWEVEGGETGDELNRVRASANYGWPDGAPGGAGMAPPSLSLAGSGFSGLAAPDPSSVLGGDLVIASLAGEDLLRVHIGRDGTPRVVSRILQRRFGRIAQVAAGADGALYFITANAPPGEPGDVLVRLAPEAPRRTASAHDGTR